MESIYAPEEAKSLGPLKKATSRSEIEKENGAKFLNTHAINHVIQNEEPSLFTRLASALFFWL